MDLDFKFWSLDFGFGLGLGCRGELADYYTPVGWSEVLLETKRDNTESNLGNLITGIYKFERSLSIFVQIPWWSSTSGMTSTSGSSTTAA